MGCLWWWNTFPVKHCMLSCNTESVSSQIRYPFLQSLESDLVCHYRKNLSPGVPSARITVALCQSIHEHVIHILILAFTVSGELLIQRWNKRIPQLILWAQLPPRQRLLPVVPCEDGDDAFFHSLHPMEQLKYA